MAVPTFTLKGKGSTLRGGPELSRDPYAGFTAIITSNIKGTVDVDDQMSDIGQVDTYFDSDGWLGGPNGVDLVAEDPDMDLSHPLAYHIRVIDTTDYKTRVVTQFDFLAGEAGEIVPLGSVTHVQAYRASGTLVGRDGRGLTGGVNTFEDGTFSFGLEGGGQTDQIELDFDGAFTTHAGDVGDMIDRSSNRALTEFYMSFRGKPNDVVPTVADTGQSVSMVTIGSGVSPQVLNGAYTVTPSTAGGKASYLRAQLLGNATRIGQRFRLRAGSTDTSNVTMAITQNPITNIWAPNMALHFVVAPTYFEITTILGTVDSPTTPAITLHQHAVGNFNLTADGVTEYEMEAWIDGGTVVYAIRDANGVDIKRGTFSHAEVVNYAGPHVFFEHIVSAYNTDRIGEITHVWASSGPSRPDVAKKAIPTVQAAVAEAGVARVLSTGDFEAIDDDLDILFTAAPSGRAIYTVSCQIQVVTEGAVAIRRLIESPLGLHSSTYQLVGNTLPVGNHHILMPFVIEDLVPGIIYSIKALIYSQQTNTVLAGGVAQFPTATLVAI